jgi:hypothetical protein
VAIAQHLPRLLVLILGGYALTAGFVALAGVALPRLGMATSEAVLLAAMLAFPLWCAVIVWGFHHGSLVRVLAVIGGGAGVSLGAAVLLGPLSVV